MSEKLVYGDYYYCGMEHDFVILGRNNEKFLKKTSFVHTPIWNQKYHYVPDLLNLKIISEMKNLDSICNRLMKRYGYTNQSEVKSDINEILNNVITKKVYIGNDNSFKNTLADIATYISKIKSLSGRQKLLKGTIVLYEYNYLIYLGNINGKSYWTLPEMDTSSMEAALYRFHALESKNNNTKLIKNQGNKLYLFDFPLSDVLEHGFQIMVLDNYDTSLLESIIKNGSSVYHTYKEVKMDSFSYLRGH